MKEEQIHDANEMLYKGLNHIPTQACWEPHNASGLPVVTKEKEFSVFQNSEIWGLQSNPELGFQLQEEL